MADKVKIPEPCLANRVMRLLEEHSSQRGKDQHAREVELKVAKQVLKAVGDDEKTANLHLGDPRERRDRESSSGQPTHRGEDSGRTAGSSKDRSPPPPPGLEASEPRVGMRNNTNVIPSKVWKIMDDESKDWLRKYGRRRRQQTRRQRLTLERRRAHIDISWQKQCSQPWQQRLEHEQRLPWWLQPSYDVSGNNTWNDYHEFKL